MTKTATLLFFAIAWKNALGNTLVLGRFSLTPGFSRVSAASARTSRFNGLRTGEKPLKRFYSSLLHGTGLKPGVNQKGVSR
jgi:hypothetical protein